MTIKTSVAIIGAGLAGLACARELQKNKIDFQIIEKSDSVGGRIKTDVIDGFTLDRGFQLYNPSYSEGMKLLNYEELDLQKFTRGIAIRDGKRLRLIEDPKSNFSSIFKTMKDFPGNPISHLALLKYFLTYLIQSDAQIAISKDISAKQALNDAGVKNSLYEKLFRPFLAGVFLESELVTSRKFMDIVIKTFFKGTPSVPSAGMQQIPLQIASQIDKENIHFNSEVLKIENNTIYTDTQVFEAKKVVIATDYSSTQKWIDLPIKKVNSVTTWYFEGNEEISAVAKSKPVLFVDAANSGPLVNAVVISNAAKTYAPLGKVLVSTSAIESKTKANVSEVLKHLSFLYGINTESFKLINKYEITNALPQMLAPFTTSNSNQLSENLFVTGDHRATSSIQGALLSGRNTATVVKVSLEA